MGESYDVLGGAVESLCQFSGSIIRSSPEEFWGVSFDNSPKLSKGSIFFLSVEVSDGKGMKSLSSELCDTEPAFQKVLYCTVLYLFSRTSNQLTSN